MTDWSIKLRNLLTDKLGGEWDVDRTGIASQFGEDANGLATVHAYKYSDSDSFRVEWALGWYEQTGEASSLEGVVVLIRAMYAAHRELNMYLDTERHLTTS